ncbi:hypothetical protein N9043_00625 [bacterium]|nr:hypothetical protein [bacterium]
MKYHPKGELCLACSYLHKDCSNLKFHEMKPVKRKKKIEKYIDGCGEWTIVHCSEFTRVVKFKEGSL